MIIPTSLKKHLPHFVKHPLIAGTNWYWRARSLPAQSVKDISIFKFILSNIGGSKVRVLEWGAGRSTFYYPEYLLSIGRDFSWHAVENSAEWFKSCSAKLTGSILEDNVQIHCFDFPPFWEVDGYVPDPYLLAAAYDDNSYVDNYVNYPLTLDRKFDLIIIDGRFRRRCLISAQKILAPNGLVVLHDAQKVHYHRSLSNFSTVEFLETGNLPGTNQHSTIALCALEKPTIIDRILRQYGSNEISAQKASRS